jgi:hypothetical protein
MEKTIRQVAAKVQLPEILRRVSCIKTIQLTACILFMGFLFSCENGNDSNDIDNDEYYVKYEVNSSTIYIGGKLNVTINTENNTNTTILINTRSAWETVIGPVKKGFNSKLQVSETGTNYGHLKLYTQISVSKNNGPFALKKIDGSDTPRTSVELNYTIDY